MALTRAVLFDLDGTLLDTAPDMVGALNALRREELRAPLPYDEIRSVVSHGAARVVKAGFPDANPESALQLQQRFLEIYRGALSRETRLFPGMDQVLDALASSGIKSGHRHQQAGLAHRAAARGAGAARALCLRGQRRYGGGAQAASDAHAARRGAGRSGA